VVNCFEAVDVIMLIKAGSYEGLELTAGQALEKRAEVYIIILPSLYSFTHHSLGIFRHLLLLPR
jgi:hypothetical protein